MRKFMLMALAALGLALMVPASASAAPVLHGNALKVAIDGVSTTESTAWHCRSWSRWCGSRRYYRYHYVYPRYRYRHRYYRRHRW
jgi:hypothetical protein